MADLTEHPLGSQELIHGDFLHAFRDQVRLPDGSTSYREYLRHPGAVMIIPLLEGEDGALQLVLERQYRYPIRQAIIEFPAGKLDEGEAPLVSAQRELLEETGYRAREWARAGLLHPTVSYSTEFIEIWFARGLSLGQRKLDEGEFLEVFTATPQQLHDWCREGRITDGKTLIGALWVQNTLNGSWPLDWRPVAGDPGP